MKLSFSKGRLISSLKSIELFRGLNDDKLALLLNHSKEVDLRASEILFREGDSGDSLFVVLSGELLVEKANTKIAHRYQGEYFGETSLSENSTRSTTVTAISKSWVLEISKDQFHLHLGFRPQVITPVSKADSNRSGANPAWDTGKKSFGPQKELNENLQHLLYETLDEIYIFDSDSYHFLRMNRPAIKNLGYTEHEITQMTLFNVVGGMNQEFFMELTKPLQQGKKDEVTYKTEHQRKDGSSYPVEIRFKLQQTDAPLVFAGIAQDISKIQELEDINTNLTFYDPLTGLPNKQLILENLNSELLPENRGDKSVAVLLMDLDEFKTVNDSMGHNAGDYLLKAATQRLLKWAPSTCRIARFGGDEFIIILTGIRFEKEAAEAASKLLKLFQEPFLIDEQEAYVSISIGISYHPFDGDDGETLIKHADTAMYFAKANGKNTYCHYSSDMEVQARNKMILERDLRKALELNEFELYYQPKLSLASETIIGFEALVRWNHPTRGLVPPRDFIPLAEKTKLIVSLGDWILRNACKQIKTWLDMGFSQVSTAVNLSAHQFNQPDLVDSIMAIIEETKIYPEYLELEITESVLMLNAKMAAEQLKQLNSVGIKISIDDFGTGYSSLSYLNSFPLNHLKIDRVFVKDITSEEDASLAKAIVNIAKALNLKTIAEGVETEAQKEVLRSIGCDIMQGYLLSEALSMDKATKFLLPTGFPDPSG